MTFEEFKAARREAKPKPSPRDDEFDALGREIEQHPILMPRAQRERRES